MLKLSDASLREVENVLNYPYRMSKSIEQTFRLGKPGLIAFSLTLAQRKAWFEKKIFTNDGFPFNEEALDAAYMAQQLRMRFLIQAARKGQLVLNFKPHKYKHITKEIAHEHA